MRFIFVSLLLIVTTSATLLSDHAKYASGLSKRQNNLQGYLPEFGPLCDGTGNTCATICGVDLASECPSPDTIHHCYNATAGEHCCNDESGHACDADYVCTHDSLARTYCCREGVDLATCLLGYPSAVGSLSTFSTTSLATASSTTSTSIITSSSTTSSSNISSPPAISSNTAVVAILTTSSTTTAPPASTVASYNPTASPSGPFSGSPGGPTLRIVTLYIVVGLIGLVAVL